MDTNAMTRAQLAMLTPATPCFFCRAEPPAAMVALYGPDGRPVTACRKHPGVERQHKAFVEAWEKMMSRSGQDRPAACGEAPRRAANASAGTLGTLIPHNSPERAAARSDGHFGQQWTS